MERLTMKPFSRLNREVSLEELVICVRVISQFLVAQRVSDDLLARVR
jgi:hypothetical protein